MLNRPTNLLLAFALFATAAQAQTPPSDSQIRRDVLAHVKPNATTVATRGEGSRHLNGGVYEFVRSITTRSPFEEMSGVEIESYGDIVYQSHGSSYQYDRYRVGDWRYLGIPAPTVEEVQAALDLDPVEAYPFGTLEQDRSLTVLTDEEAYWHNPESVTIKVRTRSRKAVSYTEVAETESVVEVRMYRDVRNGPWTRFLTTTKSEEEIGRETFSAEAVRSMRTLKDAAEIAGLESQTAALPSVSVPQFSSGLELTEYLYQVFREGDRGTVEATIRSVLAPRHFVEGSSTALGLQAQQQILDKAMTGLFGGETSFAAETCATMTLDEERSERSGRFYVLGVTDMPPRRSDRMSWTMEVKPEEASGGYSNGRALPGRIVLGDLTVGVSMQPDDIAYINSFSDEAAKCPGLVGASVQGAAGQATDSATGAAGQAADRAREAAEGAAQQGRRAIGRIFGRRD